MSNISSTIGFELTYPPSLNVCFEYSSKVGINLFIKDSPACMSSNSFFIPKMSSMPKALPVTLPNKFFRTFVTLCESSKYFHVLTWMLAGYFFP